MRASSLSNTSSASSGPPASRSTTRMCGRIASGGVHRRGRAGAVVVATRFAGFGRVAAFFLTAGFGAGAGVGAGRPWMHWDLGRSHSSQ